MQQYGAERIRSFDSRGGRRCSTFAEVRIGNQSQRLQLQVARRRRCPMWWECSECGDHIERPRMPSVCRECGTAGPIFVLADLPDPMIGDPDADNLRA
jgi:rubrerythrin